MVERRLRGVLVATALLAVVALPGCGGDGATRFAPHDPVEPGGGGRLVFAIPSAPGIPDPLHSTDSSSLLVARQIFEPLASRTPAPYGRRGLSRGLALGWHHSGDFRVWSFRLRDGVEFQDGTPLDGRAVVANARRWRTDPAGRAVLPGLIAADAPRPDTVRLILSRQAPVLPAELGDPRLGLVSPVVLGAAAGGPLPRAERAGTGPFELKEAATGTVLGRNPHWWGSRFGLGPALDEILFRINPSLARRAYLLNIGDVRVATALSASTTESLSQNPLLATYGAPAGEGIAFQRSVRGLKTWRPEPLSSVWLALLGEGGG